MNLGTDADDARLVEVAQGVLADIGDIPSDVFLAQLGVTGHALELFDMNRSEVVVLNNALRDEDRVLEVVAAPGHERDRDVLAKGHLAAIRRRTVCDHLPALTRSPAFTIGR